MISRLFASAGLAAATICAASLATVTVAGQTAPKVAATKATKEWTPPRTPWGDPDISGNYTNIDEVATPLERPDEFAGRQLDDIKGAELAAIRRKAQAQLKDRFDNDNGIHAQTSFWGWEARGQGSQAWFVREPPDGKIPPLTPEGQKRAAAARMERAEIAARFAVNIGDYTLYDRCITRGLPGSMMPAMYGDSYQIVQGPGYVAIRYEMVHETRLIPLDTRRHAGKNVRMDMGDARGHWDGNTLVVETTNFTDRSAFRNANGGTLRLVERFTRVAPDRVTWEVTVDDPSTWMKPWMFSMPLRMDDREAILEYSCHEGNYGLQNLIVIARGEQQAADDAAKKGLKPVPRSPTPSGE